MAQKWVTMSQACDILGISRRTLSRRISEGKIESKKLEGRRLVLVPDIGQDDINEGQAGTSDDLLARLKDEVEFLRQELERKDTIILQLTRSVDQAQRMLESHKEPFWRRLFRKQKE